MITLRLIFPPEGLTVSFEEEATIKDLHETACQKFGISDCTLKHGFPPSTITASETMTLSAANIHHRDRITVACVNSTTAVVEAATVKENNCPPKQSSNKNTPSLPKTVPPAAARKNQKSCRDVFIPGLAAHHFYTKSPHPTSTPSRLPGTEITGSAFDFRWKAFGSNGRDTYQISACGCISTKNQWTVHCSCPSFAGIFAKKKKKGPGSCSSNRKQVCKHLAAALGSALDPSLAAPQVVDLSGDNQNQENAATFSKQKRPHAETATNPPKKKKLVNRTPTNSSNNSDNGIIESPIKLFATRQDLQLRRQISDQSHGCWSQCKTLREMILSSQNTANNGNAGGSIQWLVVSNFLMDFDYLKALVPEIVKIPHVVIFYGQEQTPPTFGWPRSVDFVYLNPQEDPQTSANPLPYRYRFGTHHTKMFLVGFAQQKKIRVVVSTANLCRPDLENKAQAAYVEDFPLADSEDETSDFEETLVRYVDSYQYTQKREWMGHGSPKERLTDTLRRYDYSGAKGVLIPSIPGYHNIDDRTPRVGHLKLKETIAAQTIDSEVPRSVVCQFSSIGSLSEKYLLELQTSMDTHLARRDVAASKPLRLHMVYPTIQEVSQSVEGPMGGGSVPGKKRNVNKNFLEPLWRKWAAPRSSPNPLVKPDNIPHIKSYYQPNANNDGMDWLLITSHNMSRTAWGGVQDDKKYGGKQMYIQSWELGVFVSPSTLGTNKLVYWRQSPERTAAPGTATVPMPYHMYAPEAYGSNDEPWTVD